MTFTDIMRKILPDINGIDGFTYRSYINDTVSVNPPSPLNLWRSDYNDTTPTRKNRIHGGMDIYYYKQVSDETAVSIGSGEYPNDDHPLVYAFVTGKVKVAEKDSNSKGIKNGRVSILGDDGYIHTILHLNEIFVNVGDVITSNDVNAAKIEERKKLGRMGGILNGRDQLGDHVHYEITTYYTPTVQKYQKIDPEAFWNNYPTDPVNGFFLLSGSYKANNQFFGTSSKEILRGEGDHENYDIRDGGVILNDNSDDDTLSGGGGSDIIDGGTGDDKLFGGNEYEIGKYYKIEEGELKKYPEVTQDADTSSDTLIGGMGSDYLSGGKGNDTLYGGVATISGSEVNDYPDYDSSDDAAKDPSNDILIGGAGDDKLYGGGGDDILAGDAGTDVIYGGEGDDHITGGLGNDLLYGGAGNDTYYVNAGDGVDTIEDKEGNNRVILCGREINFFYEAGDGTYKSPDGKLTGVMPGGDFIVTGPDGVTKVILNEDFQWGDFGINLRPGPAAPWELSGAFNPIIGDLTPVDFDPEEPGIQVQYDEWGNVITLASIENKPAGLYERKFGRAA